jgi:hypothetical protein
MEGFGCSLIELMSRHLPAGTDENDEHLQSGDPVCGPRFEISTF